MNSFVPKHLLKPEEQQKSVNEFTDQLFGTTSSEFSPISPREPTPPRDPAKSKEVAIVTEQVNELITYQEEGGSIPEMPKIKSFITPEGNLSQEEFTNQIKELKRISDLKAKKISFRADQLPITKISYVVNQNKEATMKIIKGDNPLNLVVDLNFMLKTLGFSEWMEVIDQAKKLGLHPPPALATFGMIAEDKKRKRTEILKEEPELEIFFYNGNWDLVFQREEEFRLETTAQLIRLQSSIQRSTPKTNEMFRKLELTIEARDDVDQARDIVMLRLSECKALESNVRRIRVKDIVKKVKDYLKTYSSAGIDVSWRETQYLLKVI
ncbi:hypothetical protein Tco_0561465 [Tanacetum coccineum]